MRVFRWSTLEPYASSEPADEAYARAGLDFAKHLEGEFAAFVCDGRRVVAARSALSGPALFYVRLRDGIALAEAAEPLVPLTDRIVDPQTIRDFLRGQLVDPERTFWRGLRRLPPGHWIVATSSEVQVRRWFHPPAEGSATPDALRAHLERAVACRLDPERPTMVHVSGGVDSSAVAALAVRTGRPVILASGRYPGLPCDEGRYIAAARSRLDAPFREWDGSRTRAFDFDGPATAHPWLELAAGDAEAEAELAHAAGARVIMTGHGGDELFFERGAIRDLVRHGNLTRFFREARLAPRYSTSSAAFWLKDGLRGLLRRPRADSHTQASTWSWLTSSHAGWIRDLQDQAFARTGLTYRRPLLDGALAQCVLALPWQARVPSGRMKALLRDAVRDLLPDEIVERTGVTTFESAIAHHMRAARSGIARLLEEGHWRSEPYFARADARLLHRALDSDDFAAAQTLHAVASIERWLRAIEHPAAFG